MHASKVVRRSLGVAAGVVLVAGVIGFGVAQGAVTGTARGTVYRDANNNGRRDSGEVGVAGIVVQSPGAATVTNATGQWVLKVTGKQRIEVLTGWYRSQCNALTCTAGPGRCSARSRVDSCTAFAAGIETRSPWWSTTSTCLRRSRG